MARRKLTAPPSTDAATPRSIEATEDELGPDHAPAPACDHSTGCCCENMTDGPAVMSFDMTAGPLDLGAGGTAVIAAVEECIDQPELAENLHQPPERPSLSNVEGVPSDPVRIVAVDLPLLSTPAYASNTLRRLEPRHARILRDLADGLGHEGVKYEGRAILSTDDALAWLLEQLCAATQM